MKTMLMTMLSTMTMAVCAQEATPDTWMNEAKSVASRADVVAEAMQLRERGELGLEHRTGYLPRAARSRLRAEVVAELHAARDSGELGRIAAEAHDFAPVPGATAFASRQVLARAR